MWRLADFLDLNQTTWLRSGSQSSEGVVGVCTGLFKTICPIPEIYYSVTKYYMNILHAPNCTPTLNFAGGPG